jgi:6-phosphogluconolactonase (cycloisomerase 2 family)
MLSRLARMAGAAALIVALTAPIAQAASPSAYVYATSRAQTVRLYTADEAGLLADLWPPDVTAGSTSTWATVSPDDHSLYVVNQTSATVSQYDIQTDGTLAPKASPTVPTGRSPLGMAIAPDGRHVYVANQGAANVSVYAVDAAGTLTPVSTAPAGNAPGQIAITPDGAHAYVTNFSDGSVSQYDVDATDGSLTAAGTVATLTSPAGIAVSPEGDSVYVADQGSAAISQYSVGSDGALSPKDPETVPAGTQPREVLAVDSSVYVSNLADGTISQYEARADGTLRPKAPAAVEAPASPTGLAASPDGRSVYVAGFADSVIGQYDVRADGALSAMEPFTAQADFRPSALAVARPPDLEAPTVDLRTPKDGAQYTVGARVEADYSCADEGGSGLKSCTGDVADGEPIDTATAGDRDFTVTARDGAGHETTVTHSYTVVEPPRDDQAPTIGLRAPADGARYDLDEPVTADYSCADEGGSGLESCTGDVADGDAIDTATAGEHTFSVVARDGEGNETTVSHSYTVADTGFAGFVGSIQDGSSVRAGSEVPIRFSLGGFRGDDVLTDGSPSSVRVDCDDPGEPTGGRPAASDDGLRFDASAGTYTFAWETQRSWAWTCRAFILTLRDGSVHRLVVSFRQGSWSHHSSYRHWKR